MTVSTIINDNSGRDDWKDAFSCILSEIQIFVTFKIHNDFFYPNQQAIPSSHFLLYQSGDQERNIETNLNFQFDFKNS